LTIDSEVRRLIINSQAGVDIIIEDIANQVSRTEKVRVAQARKIAKEIMISLLFNDNIDKYSPIRGGVKRRLLGIRRNY